MSVAMPGEATPEVFVHLVVHHPRPDTVVADLWLNRDRPGYAMSDWVWRDGDGGVVKSVTPLDSEEGCHTTAAHPTCFRIEYVGALGEVYLRSAPENEGFALWEAALWDSAADGASGSIRQLTVVNVGE